MSMPVLQALLVADHVYQDRGTGKYLICGVFSVLYKVPEGAGPTVEEINKGVRLEKVRTAGSPQVYLSLTELNGKKSFQLRYVDLQDNSVLFVISFDLSCSDPLQTVEGSIALPLLPSPRYGVYALELLCEDELLGTHRVQVQKSPDFKGSQS